MDSNHDKQNQNLLCYRYTTGQNADRRCLIVGRKSNYGRGAARRMMKAARLLRLKPSTPVRHVSSTYSAFRQTSRRTGGYGRGDRRNVKATQKGQKRLISPRSRRAGCPMSHVPSRRGHLGTLWDICHGVAQSPDRGVPPVVSSTSPKTFPKRFKRSTPSPPQSLCLLSDAPSHPHSASGTKWPSDMRGRSLAVFGCHGAH